MHRISRRSFLKTTCVSAMYATVGKSASLLMADPLGLPIGLQLYSVRELLPKDYEGTLRQVAAMGYREVEAAGFFGHSASEVKQAMHTVGLNCVSAHYPMAQLQSNREEIIGFGKELGLKYIICSSPMMKDSSQPRSGSMGTLTLDDWRWNAEQLNHLGEQVHAAGLQFGYHNHFREFRAVNGVLPYDELLRLTDPAKVTMEMDCGWVVVGGQNPADYLTKHHTRFSMLHVKDFKLTGAGSESAEPLSTEMGRGSIDYRPIFLAAKKAGVRHYFVEQEHFDIPPMEALKLDADYMHAMTV
jgi:sugar phosphate isomerase/epimerase